MSNHTIASLVAARYGADADADTAADTAHVALNHTLQTLLSHKSVRNFAAGQDKLPAGTIDVLVAAAQSAATSSNLQAWSVVVVQDPTRKSELATLAGDQQFIRDAPLFFLFVADLHRADVINAKTGAPGGALPYTELFLVAALDAAFAAQNTVVAAESLGLGACYVGAARNRAREVASLLQLPARALVLFGLAVGVPDTTAPAVTAPVKPRLPAAEVVHHETWNDAEQEKHLDEYDAIVAAFNADQRAGQPTWTQRSAARVANEAALHGRHELLAVLQERNLALK